MACLKNKLHDHFKLVTVLQRYYSKSSQKPGELLKEDRKPVGYKTKMRIYNSSVKEKVDLITKENGVISWYCCGPTVYDSAHIGHACSYIRFDIIRRIMEEIFLQKVIFILGITDIDDKIINRASAKGVDFKTLSQFYEKEFFRDMLRLNIKNPTVTARVSDNILEIIKFVSKIVNSGYGYVTLDGTVNFLVNNYDGYGVLVEAQEEVCEDDSEKESSRDFAMWKGSKPGEPSWSSPWGDGRPGWHIECSTIASKLLGNKLDIHSGGVDLKFPHHENEEAQSCVYHNVKSWVTYWMHSGHLHVRNAEKMSKSLNNTISIDQFLDKYSPDHIRMLCMMVPYRNGVEYSDEVMENAINVYNKFRNFINDCNAYISGSKAITSFDEAALLMDLDEVRKTVTDNLADDFDTSKAISGIIQFITKANSIWNQKSNNMDGTSYFSVIAAREFVESFLVSCGFLLNENVGDISIGNDILLETSVHFRSKIRNLALSLGKNTQEIVDLKKALLNACDEYRKEMVNAGVEMKDFGKTSSWNYVRKVKI